MILHTSLDTLGPLPLTLKIERASIGESLAHYIGSQNSTYIPLSRAVWSGEFQKQMFSAL